MNKIVKSAITTAAGKILKLKTSQKIAIGAAAAVRQFSGEKMHLGHGDALLSGI